MLCDGSCVKAFTLCSSYFWSCLKPSNRTRRIKDVQILILFNFFSQNGSLNPYIIAQPLTLLQVDIIVFANKAYIPVACVDICILT